MIKKITYFSALVALALTTIVSCKKPCGNYHTIYEVSNIDVSTLKVITKNRSARVYTGIEVSSVDSIKADSLFFDISTTMNGTRVAENNYFDFPLIGGAYASKECLSTEIYPNFPTKSITITTLNDFTNIDGRNYIAGQSVNDMMNIVLPARYADENDTKLLMPLTEFNERPYYTDAFSIVPDEASFRPAYLDTVKVTFKIYYKLTNDVILETESRPVTIY